MERHLFLMCGGSGGSRFRVSKNGAPKPKPKNRPKNVKFAPKNQKMVLKTQKSSSKTKISPRKPFQERLNKNPFIEPGAKFKMF